MDSVYDRIAKKIDDMSKSQKKIARFILGNRDDVAFMNVSELASAADVSEASIVRFALFMEYKGYPQLQNDLQNSARERLGIRDRLTMSYAEYDENDAGIAKIFNEDINRIQRTLSMLNFDNLHTVIEKLLGARKIYIVCGRSAVALGMFFQYYLDMAMGNVELISSFDGNEEKMYDICNEDVAIAITFDRYTRKTVELLDFAKERGAITVSITDTMVSPVIKNSQYYFLTDTRLDSYLDSFVAPLSLINAILTYIGKCKNSELEDRLSKLENIWQSFDVFK